jgi:cobalamin biosynthesis protein CbiG
MKMLSVGIGCRLHSSAEQIEAAVRAALGSHAFDQIGVVASIDTKAGEAGLLEFCARHALPLKLFSREQIAATPVAKPSASVREHLGVDGVCEPCALLAATAEFASAASAIAPAAPPSSQARLIVPKTVHGGVAVAIASLHPDAHQQTSTDTHEHEQDLP